MELGRHLKLVDKDSGRTNETQRGRAIRVLGPERIVDAVAPLVLLLLVAAHRAADRWRWQWWCRWWIGGWKSDAVSAMEVATAVDAVRSREVASAMELGSTVEVAYAMEVIGSIEAVRTVEIGRAMEVISSIVVFLGRGNARGGVPSWLEVVVRFGLRNRKVLRK